MIRAASDKYDISYAQFYDTLKCESKLNPQMWNKADPNGGSKGIAQFQPATFARYSKLAGVTDANVWDASDSIEVAAYMFSKGQQHQWTCYRLLFA